MKQLFMALLIITVACTATAQTGFGFKGGLNRFALTGDDQSYNNALHFGAFAQIKLGGQFAVQPELLFSNEGNAFEENNIKSGTYLSYVNIPVMAQVVTKSGFYAEAGPGFGFLLSAKYKETGIPKEDIKKFLKGFNVFFAAGLGYRLKMGLGFGIRYNFGISNIAVESADKTKSSGAQVSVSYKFNGIKGGKK